MLIRDAARLRAPRCRGRGCNPLSTNDAVAAALADERHPDLRMARPEHRGLLLVHRPAPSTRRRTLTLDDGADLIFTRPHQATPRWPSTSSAAPKRPRRACTACARWPADGKLLYPVIAVNDAETKWDFDNVYGTGQSTLDGIIRATSVLLAGQELRRRRLRPLRKGVRDARQGHGRERDRRPRSRPTAALKATLGGQPRDDDGRGLRGRRHLRDGHRHQGHHRQACTSSR